MPTSLIGAAVAGAFAGGLHALTGPDHIATLLPQVIGVPLRVAYRIGLVWGLGHGLGASLMGAVAFTLKGMLNIHFIGNMMELFVGVTLIIIGLIGYRDSQRYLLKHQRSTTSTTTITDVEHGGHHHSHGHHARHHDHHHHHQGDGDGDGDDDDAAKTLRLSSVTTTRAVLATGILHGFSGSGHWLGLVPALSLPSTTAATLYLSAFCVGTTVAMSIFTALIGYLSMSMKEYLQQPDLPARLASYSSMFAIGLGLLWILNAISAS